jgi:Flp pilus assembly protein TadG
MKLKKKQSGQALVEFAFVVPMLLLLLLGIVEIGRYAYISILIGNAARAGAAYGAQSNGLSNDQTGIANAADYDFAGATSGPTKLNGQSVSLLTVSSTTSCGCDSSGTITTYGCTATNAGNCPLLGSPSGNWVIMVNVTASGTFNALFSFPGIPGSLVISRTATMRVG